jgi:hypothetical protein
MQRAKLFAYVNNNIYDIKRILQDKQFHLQLRSEQKEIIQNVLERKDVDVKIVLYSSVTPLSGGKMVMNE